MLTQNPPIVTVHASHEYNMGMTSIARKNLQSDRPKLLASVGGVALAVLLVLSLLSVYFGSSSQARAFPEHSGVNRWVTQKGTSDLFHTVSILPAGLDRQLRQVPGVTAVSPLVNHATKVMAGDEMLTAAIFGFDPATRFGGPWKVVEGTDRVGPGEAVVDRTLARSYGIRIGDSITVDRKPFKVVGISTQSNSIVLQYIFVRLADAQAAFAQPDIVSYYLVQTTDPAALERAVPGIAPNAEVKTIGSVADANQKLIKKSFLPIILLLVFIGLAVGVTVIGLTLYTATAERAREFAVLKAVGVGNRRLYRIVTTQSLLVSLVGFVVGLGLFWVVQQIGYYAAPAVAFSLDTPYYGYVLAGVIVMSVGASFIPIRKVTRIDPVEVFNA